MRRKVVALWAALVLITLLALLGLGRALGPAGIDWSFGITPLAIWWMTLCIAAAGTVIATGRLRVLMGLCILCAAGVIVMLCLGGAADPEWLLWGLWFGAAALAHVGLLMVVRLERLPSRVVRLATLASLAVVTVGAFPSAPDHLHVTILVNEDLIRRIVMAAAVLSAAGTLAVFLFAAIESLQQPAPESLPSAVALAAACPRCNAPNTFPAGQSECQSCSLRVTLGIEEPRCPCGYLLYKLNSPHCPECGRLVRHEPSKGKTTINA